jgi:hypothetical protein
MKIKIGPYKNWFGPYQLANALCFWVKKRPNEDGILDKPDWVHDFGEWLAHGDVKPDPEVGGTYSLFDEDRHITLLYKFLMWVEDKKTRKIKVRIDPYDTWSLDHTLGLIALPMLKQLQATKHGSPWVDDEDVPENLRSGAAPPKENDYDTDDNHHLRWDWVIGEMIFAFETKCGELEDWQDQFHTGKREMRFKKLENGNSEMVRGEGDTSHFDAEGQKAYQERISNGFRLFGKYYEGLWD